MTSTNSNKKKAKNQVLNNNRVLGKNNRCSYLEVIMITSHDKSKERKISRKRKLSFQRREYKQENNQSRIFMMFFSFSFSAIQTVKRNTIIYSFFFLLIIGCTINENKQ